MITVKRRLFNALTNWLSDEQYFQLLHLLKFKKIPNIREPRTFNEKILWRIVFDRKEIYSRLTDKVAMREYIAELGLKAHLPIAYYIGNNPKDIPFDELPKSFVVKPNHLSGRVLFVDDKDDFDRESLFNICEKWLAFSYYDRGREWPYKNIIPHLIVEENLGDNSKLPVYKVHCFHGQPKITDVGIGYFTASLKYASYDNKWSKQEMGYPTSRITDIPPPEKLHEMLEFSARLSTPFDYVRVDLYQVHDRILVSELTFTPTSGLNPYWGKHNQILGDYWSISVS